MIFSDSSSVPETWDIIKKSMVNGDLGDLAKVNISPNPAFVFVIYVRDFTGKADVLRVRQSMARLGLTKKLIHFKPCCYTALGIHTCTFDKFPTSIYSAGGDNDTDCQTLFVTGTMCDQKGVDCPHCFPECKIQME